MSVDVVQQYVVDFQYLLDYAPLNVQFDKINFQFQLQVELEYFQTKISNDNFKLG